ncbi:type IV secretion system protein VirB10 [Asticcacaulis solisilvae]|uniref:type IV secretion system protein VirB10 n=1 Tax=Asticcacaulis solisilvae TaxID=1217274 RepID=UPI003FD823CB
MAAPRNTLPSGNDPRLKMTPDDLEAASERALPKVARGGSGMDTTMIVGTICILGLGALVFVVLDKQPPRQLPPPPPVQAAPPVQQQPSTLPPINPSLNTPIEQPQTPLVQPMPAQPQAQAPQQDPNAMRAPALVIDNSSAPSPQQPAAQAAAGGGAATLSANDQFAARVSGDVTQKAQKIGDPSKVVPQGSVIPAVLETAINSDLPGYTRAVVSRDIRSFDGTTVLIPRGSRLVGQYKSGLASGETRAFIIWTRLLRPDGLSVQLASPGIDDIGQAGMSGSVDTHFAKRFGAAMLLSVVNGLAGSLKSSSSSTIVIGTSADAQNVATEALSNDVKIPPTIKVGAGAPIQVFAARDLDFALGQ